ncbi:hypothetical protein [Candidatus Formimonas warabiya]|uniref:hypothetical protein n=1 Tax=Formimonas warabiya TaxID=1761012 RepID=UPI001BE400B3|nr:hypothetical protein [Candidatus Formimonas warabiya]
MREGKKYAQKVKLLLLSLVLGIAVLGIFFTYQSQGIKNPGPGDKPVQTIKPGEIIKTAVQPTVKAEAKENPEKATEQKNAVDTGTEEKSVPRKTTDLASRATPVKQEHTAGTESNEKTSASQEKVETKPEQSQSLPTAEKAATDPEQNQPAPASQATPSQAPAPQTSNDDTTLNSYVLDVIDTYAGGYYPYLLNDDYANYNGVTENLYYQGKVLLKADPGGSKASFCSGITFEVFFKAMQNRNIELGLSPDDFNGMSFDQLFDFALTWYAATGNKETSNVSIAVEKYGIGKRITDLEDARAGDFIDVSRENYTGHTAVFLNWLRDQNGRIIGFKYWSSQESTKGISYKEEYFNVTDSNGRKYGTVMRDTVNIARVSAVGDYQ